MAETIFREPPIVESRLEFLPRNLDDKFRVLNDPVGTKKREAGYTALHKSAQKVELKRHAPPAQDPTPTKKAKTASPMSTPTKKRNTTRSKPSPLKQVMFATPPTATKRKNDSTESSPSKKAKYAPNPDFKRETRSSTNTTSTISTPGKSEPISTTDLYATTPTGVKLFKSRLEHSETPQTLSAERSTVDKGRLKIKLRKAKKSDPAPVTEAANESDAHKGAESTPAEDVKTADIADTTRTTRTKSKAKAASVEAAIESGAHEDTDEQPKQAVKTIATPRAKGKGKAASLEDVIAFAAREAAEERPKQEVKTTETARPTRSKGKAKAIASDDPTDLSDAHSDTEEEPEDESEVETPRKTRAKGKGKATAKATTTASSSNSNGFATKVPKDFVGKGTNLGTSSNKPANAPLDQPWRCANRSCNSGQTWHYRDGDTKKSNGRKVISNFFGRNKKETNYIHLEVWHHYCRKDYQRGTYRVDKIGGKIKCDHYTDNIETQLQRLQMWRPEARFKVQLNSGATTRLNKYFAALAKNNNDVAAAEAAVHVAPRTNKKNELVPLKLEDEFPPKYLDQFQSQFPAQGVDYDYLATIIAWTRNLVNTGEITSMPPMEFLITKEADNEAGVTDPNTNYMDWVQTTATPAGSSA